MNEREFENFIVQKLISNENELNGLGFAHKSIKKFAKKIVKKAKKAIIPATKIARGFIMGGPAGAAIAAGKLGVGEVGRKKAKAAAKKAEQKARAEQVAYDKALVAEQLLAQDGINFSSPEGRGALRSYVNKPDPMRYALPIAGGVAAIAVTALILKG